MQIRLNLWLLMSAVCVSSCHGQGLPQGQQDGAAAAQSSLRSRTATRDGLCKQPFPGVPLNYRPGDKVLALTFDDGPEAKGLPAILDVLKRHDVPAAFFVNTYAESSWLQPFNSPANKAAVRRALSEGHEVGSHAAQHLRLSQLPPAEARSQVLWAIGNLSAVTGGPIPLFRAPYGDGFMGLSSDPGVASPALQQLWQTVRQHHVHIAWSFSGEDYNSVKPEQPGCVDRAFQAYGPPLVQAGVTGVVLLHSTRNAMGGCPAGLDRLIPYWKANGYSFVSVSELVEDLYGGMPPEEVVAQARRCPTAQANSTVRPVSASAAQTPQLSRAFLLVGVGVGNVLVRMTPAAGH